MDRYQRVEKPRPEEPINENEIRITAQGLIRNYISYATTLLQEKQAREIILKAMGQAISKTVVIAEIIKKRIPGLYQETSISSTSLTDVWEPIEEGLETLEINRLVSLITITLSTSELDNNSPGYQAPSNVEQPKAEHQYQQWQQLPPRQACRPITVANEDSHGIGRGRDGGRGYGYGRGRGRLGGRGRGGGDGNQT